MSRFCHVQKNRFFHAQEIVKPEDVIPYLAKRERHWKRGYSAYELAYSWVGAGGIPDKVRSVLETCPDYAGATLVEGLFEREVDLRTPGRRSQTDLLAFVNSVHGYAVIAVEGKVDEPVRRPRLGLERWQPRQGVSVEGPLRVSRAQGRRYGQNPLSVAPSGRPRPSMRLSGTRQRGRSCWCIRSA